ncbi:hypothetical protein [Nocardia callitridis]|uniref:Secreted protein n=1 Tax=Nocardia callitridis TaxID=648753 RepID=A0ABP9KGD1_9NOCA
MSRLRVLLVLFVIAAIGIGGMFVWKRVFGTTVDRRVELGGIVCDVGGKVTNTADYRSGPSPHGLVVFLDKDSTYSEKPVKDTGSEGPLRAAQRDKQIADIQLVACVDRDSEQALGRSCDFDGGTSLPVYRPRYHVRVYESKTHRKVSDQFIDAQSEAEFTCPTLYFDEGERKIQVDPDYPALAALLTPLVR